MTCSDINNKASLNIQRFQRHVHTYRILPDTDGLLAVQVSVEASQATRKMSAHTHTDK